MRNAQLVSLFNELASLTKLEDGNPQSFRARAYEAAARTLERLPGDSLQMGQSELVALKGIGKSTASKISEFAATGRISKLDELRAQYPPGFIDLIRLPGLGMKKAARLRDELGVGDVADLQAAIREQALRELPGFGAKTEENLLRAIDRLGLVGKERRLPIVDAMPVASGLVGSLERLPEVEQVLACGSLRRMRETVADLDIVVAAEDAQSVMAWFTAQPLVESVLGAGDTKSSIVTVAGLQIDLRVVSAAHMGAAVLYFTGSKAHNIRLRQLALERGWTLNEYDLADVETGEAVAADTEEGIYAALGLQWVPPPMREDTGEIEAAASDSLPAVVTYDDLRGDFHVHTDLSGDGKSSLPDMVGAARSRGWEYLAVTDHAEGLTVSGVGREEMLAQRRRLRRFSGITLLHGAELNIGADGTLDYDDEFLSGFDLCVASVHSHFDLAPDQQTERVLRAMKHPAVKVIGHLTGRRIGRRPGIELDWAAVIDGAESTQTALEINSNLDRLDAPAELVLQAAERDVLFAICSDAHHRNEFDNLHWGVAYAQRAWVEVDRVVNAWSLERLSDWLQVR